MRKIRWNLFQKTKELELKIGTFLANIAEAGDVFAFVGAKGGVGSSTIAHNIGWALSQRQNIDTIITDLDLAFGTAGLNFNQDSMGGILDALGQPDRVDTTLLDRLLTKLGDKLSLLSGPGGVDRVRCQAWGKSRRISRAQAVSGRARRFASTSAAGASISRRTRWPP